MIRVIFDSEIEFGKWLQAIRENSKTDEELAEIARKTETYRQSMQGPEEEKKESDSNPQVKRNQTLMNRGAPQSNDNNIF